MRYPVRVCAAAVFFLVLEAGAAEAAGCAPQAHCIPVDQNGQPNPAGTFTAQCSGTFPDSVDIVPADYAGPRFVLSQKYPKTLPKTPKFKWDTIDFKTQDGANQYLLAIRDYIYKGMIPADWVPAKNKKAHWVHVPWMTAGPHPREFVRGLTQERALRNPELG